AGEVPAAAAARRARADRAGATGAPARCALAVPRAARAGDNRQWRRRRGERAAATMSVDWKQRPEGGGRLAVWVMRTVARHGGRPLARLVLYPVSLYFLLRRGPERRASIAFLDRALGRPARLRDCARHVHAFASVTLDRLFLLDGDENRFRIDVTGLEALSGKVDQGRGVLLFGSHLGSFEEMRALSRQRPG